MFKPSVTKRFISNSPNRLLKDNHGRIHDYLRISITERCNLRCTYCMPEEGLKLQSNDSYLKLEELERVSSLFVKSCGVRKIRITGGEPTIDNKLAPLLKYLNQLRESGLETIAITTNGLSLKKFSKLYKSLGLNAVNISLDTLQEVRYQTVTRKNGFKLAYEGLLTALDTGFDCVKLNCVVMAGFNEDEILNFAQLAEKYPLEVRFIEFMPFASNNWNSSKMLPFKHMLEIARSKYPDLKSVVVDENVDTSQISKVYKTKSMLGSLGFISSISDNFCSTCNRLRVTADGHFKGCLFNREEVSLKDLMRNGATDAEIVSAIKTSLARKNKQHGGIGSILGQTMRPMVRIGG